MSEKVSVIVLAWNGEKYLQPCLQALLAQEYSPFEILVVDNASTDGSVAVIEKFSLRVRLTQNAYNLGFSAGNNVGIDQVDGDIVVLLNQDTVVQPGWLRAIAETFADSSIGIVGCKALYMDGHGFQHAGGIVRRGDAFTTHIGWGEVDHGQYDQLTEPDYVTGAAFAIHRRVLNRIGKLDEEFYPGFYEETDYCYRARRAGLRVVYQPRAVLQHHETTTLPEDNPERARALHRNRVRFILRHWSKTDFELFADAERKAIDSGASIDDDMARAHAYWDNLLAVPLVAAQRRIDSTLGGIFAPGQTRWLIETLQSLRRRAQQHAVTLMTSAAQSVELPSQRATMPAIEKLPLEKIDLASARAALKNLETPLEFNPSDLDSHSRWFSGWVTRLRRFVVTFAVRPYVLRLAQQQTDVNVQIAKALKETQQLLVVLQQQNEILAQQNDALMQRDQWFVEQDSELARQNDWLAQRVGDLMTKNNSLTRLCQSMNDDEGRVSLMLEKIIDIVEKQNRS